MIKVWSGCHPRTKRASWDAAACWGHRSPACPEGGWGLAAPPLPQHKDEGTPTKANGSLVHNHTTVAVVHTSCGRPPCWRAPWVQEAYWGASRRDWKSTWMTHPSEVAKEGVGNPLSWKWIAGVWEIWEKQWGSIKYLALFLSFARHLIYGHSWSQNAGLHGPQADPLQMFLWSFIICIMIFQIENM